VAPIYLLKGSELSASIFDHLAWAVWYFLIRLVKTGDARYWIPIGMQWARDRDEAPRRVSGVAVAAGTLLTSNRRFMLPLLWAATGWVPDRLAEPALAGRQRLADRIR
jgi:hypothetical protein